jgi:FkbH-like protein
MVVSIDRPNAFGVTRFAQLTQRTNQFNLTTRRYTESEIRSLIDDPAYDLYTVSLQDRFGALGVIGAAILHRQSQFWRLDTFLMSCRALGRGVEDAFLATLTADAAKAGATVQGEFVVTKKNDPARQFLRRLKLDSSAADTANFQFEIVPGQIDVPNWIVIQDRSAVRET